MFILHIGISILYTYRYLKKEFIPMEVEVFWQLKNITMCFPGVIALNDVSLDIYKGEIIGLIGENGSGKSTLIKCLSGVNQPQKGEFYCQGKPVKITNSAVSRKLGVSTVYQEFSLVPTLTVTENIFLGRLLKDKKGFVDWRTMHEKTRSILDTMQIDIDQNAIICNLSVAEQQLVEIAKGYTANSSLMILDEPTTALTAPEIKRLHELLRKLATTGHTIIYISHRIDTIMEFVDRIAVLKNGMLAGIVDISEITMDEIVKMMSGRQITEHYPKQRNVQDEVILKVENLTTETGVNSVSFEVRKGEVFGLAGLLGSGRTEIARALFGVDKVTGGKIYFKGKEVKFNNPQQAIEAGMAYITESRKIDGLFLNFNGPKNSTTARIKKLFKSKRLHILDLKKESKTYDESNKQLAIEPTSVYKFVGFLSGGNQQKVVISRWLFAEADFFIMDEPTQGIDVGSRIEVYNIINKFTAAGKSVLLVSSDHLELLSMSDTIGNLKFGKITSIVDVRDADKKTNTN